MDDKKFDSLAKLIGKGASRRTVFKGLFGLGGAAIAGEIAPEGVDARAIGTAPTSGPGSIPTPTTPACMLPGKMCNGSCCTSGNCVNGVCCAAGQKICGNTCCAAGSTCAGNTCCDPSTSDVCGTECCPRLTSPQPHTNQRSTCARDGNQDFCCVVRPGHPEAWVCGLECCDSEYQCCDRECCPTDQVCMARVFNSSANFFEEHCCPVDQACDSTCCDGSCYDPAAITPPVLDGILNANFVCCPADSEVCAGTNGSLCCPDGTKCCVRGGVAICIADDACCTDVDCALGECDVCDITDPINSQCVPDHEICQEEYGLCSQCSALGVCEDVEALCGTEGCLTCVNGQCIDSDAECPDECSTCFNGNCVFDCTDGEDCCDDGNACTVDTCDPVNGCVYTTLDCDDNDVCTTDSCNPETGCVHTPVDCDDNISCTVDRCNNNPTAGPLGCSHTPDPNACSGDNPCFVCDPECTAAEITANPGRNVVCRQRYPNATSPSGALTGCIYLGDHTQIQGGVCCGGIFTLGANFCACETAGDECDGPNGSLGVCCAGVGDVLGCVEAVRIGSELYPATDGHCGECVRPCGECGQCNVSDDVPPFCEEIDPDPCQGQCFACSEVTIQGMGTGSYACQATDGAACDDDDGFSCTSGICDSEGECQPTPSHSACEGSDPCYLCRPDCIDENGEFDESCTEAFPNGTTSGEDTGCIYIGEGQAANDGTQAGVCCLGEFIPGAVACQCVSEDQTCALNPETPTVLNGTCCQIGDGAFECVDLEDDDDHCGTCRFSCGECGTCGEGECIEVTGDCTDPCETCVGSESNDGTTFSCTRVDPGDACEPSEGVDGTCCPNGNELICVVGDTCVCPPDLDIDCGCGECYFDDVEDEYACQLRETDPCGTCGECQFSSVGNTPFVCVIDPELADECGECSECIEGTSGGSFTPYNCTVTGETGQPHDTCETSEVCCPDNGNLICTVLGTNDHCSACGDVCTACEECFEVSFGGPPRYECLGRLDELGVGPVCGECGLCVPGEEGRDYTCEEYTSYVCGASCIDCKVQSGQTPSPTDRWDCVPDDDFCSSYSDCVTAVCDPENIEAQPNADGCVVSPIAGFCDECQRCDELLGCQDDPDNYTCDDPCETCQGPEEGPFTCQQVDPENGCLLPEGGLGVCCPPSAGGDLICVENEDGDPYCLGCRVCEPCYECKPECFGIDEPTQECPVAADANGCVPVSNLTPCGEDQICCPAGEDGAMICIEGETCECLLDCGCAEDCEYNVATGEFECVRPNDFGCGECGTCVLATTGTTVYVCEATIACEDQCDECRQEEGQDGPTDPYFCLPDVGAACADSDNATCTTGVCDANGNCVPTPIPGFCNDSNPCTTDVCAPGTMGANPTTGCVNTPVASGAPCIGQSGVCCPTGSGGALQCQAGTTCGTPCTAQGNQCNTPPQGVSSQCYFCNVALGVCQVRPDGYEVVSGGFVQGICCEGVYWPGTDACCTSEQCPSGPGFCYTGACTNHLCVVVPPSSGEYCDPGPPDYEVCCRGICLAASASGTPGGGGNICPVCQVDSDCCSGCCHYAVNWTGCAVGSLARQGIQGHCHNPDTSFDTNYPCKDCIPPGAYCDGRNACCSGNCNLSTFRCPGSLGPGSEGFDCVTCEFLNRTCGIVEDDGCGNPLDCGVCEEFPNSFCDEEAGGICACKAKDFCDDGDIGLVDDGCGGTISCEVTTTQDPNATTPAPDTTPPPCVPTHCAQVGCGGYADACDGNGAVYCGDCCTPTTCAQVGCGNYANDCVNGQVYCGDCTTPPPPPPPPGSCQAENTRCVNDDQCCEDMVCRGRNCGTSGQRTCKTRTTCPV